MDEATVQRMLRSQRAIDEGGVPAKEARRKTGELSRNGKLPRTEAASQAPPAQLGEPILFGPEPGAGSCEAAVVFLHGIGDRPGSWASTFAPLRKQSPRWMWVHLRAPKLLQPYNGRLVASWGKVSSYHCMHVGSKDHEERAEQDLYQSAVEAIRLTVEMLHEVHHVPIGRVVIAGFSQGAAVSLLAALSFPRLFVSCVAMSGWLLPCARDLLKKNDAPRAPQILLCHGRVDEFIGHDCGAFAAMHLQKAGLKVQFQSFEELGHFTNGVLLKVVANFMHLSLTGKELHKFTGEERLTFEMMSGAAAAGEAYVRREP